MLEKLVIAIVILLAYILQSSVDFLTIGHIRPDLLLLVTMYFALSRDDFFGLWVGFSCGLLQDINLGGISEIGTEKINYYIGINVLSKSIVGYICGKFSEMYRNDNFVFIFISVTLFSIVQGFLILFLIKIFYENISITNIVTIIIPSALYNSFLSLFFFKVLDNILGIKKETIPSGKSTY